MCLSIYKDYSQYIRKGEAIMKCPYCQSDVIDVSGFCNNCGQAISDDKAETKESDAFWKKTEKDESNRYRQNNRIKEVEKETRNRAAKNRIMISIASILAIVAVVFIIMTVNNKNEEKLRLAMQSVKGKTYTDDIDISPGTILGAHHPEIKKLVFNNDGTVNYSYSIGDYNSSPLGYEIVDVRESATYKYDMSIDFFGNISISIYKHGSVWETYDADIWSDGKVHAIDMFD